MDGLHLIASLLVCKCSSCSILLFFLFFLFSLGLAGAFLRAAQLQVTLKGFPLVRMALAFSVINHALVPSRGAWTP